MDPSTISLTLFVLIMASPLATMGHAPPIPECDGNSPEDFVQAHNKARAEVGVPLVVWNKTLAEYARQYAEKRSEDCVLQHSQGPYGECIAEGVDLTGTQAVELWVSEKKDFDPLTKTCRGSWEMCGHYTQVVWCNTKCIGCARAKCKNNDWTFVTCNYNPPGNYEGEFPY